MEELKQYAIPSHKTFVTLERSSYLNNNTLFIGLFENWDGKKSYFGDLTTNLPRPSLASGTKQYVQTDLYGLDAVKWLEENEIAKRVGVTTGSGWKTYELMDFSPSLENIPPMVLDEA